MTTVSQSHGVESPSTLVVSPDQHFVYAANESHDFQGIGYGGGVTAFSFDPQTGETKKSMIPYPSAPAPVTLTWIKLENICWWRTTAAGFISLVFGRKQENWCLMCNVTRDVYPSL